MDEKVFGLIKYYNLDDWWLKSFSNDEREYIKNTYKPLGIDDNNLTQGNFIRSSQSVIGFLWILSGWFHKKEDRTIAYRIISKAEQLIDFETDILDLHFLYQNKLQIYYKFRDYDQDALTIAINTCKQQINISKQAKECFLKEYPKSPLPLHKGFEQLTIMEEKNKNYQTAIILSKEALNQGWAGDWEKRIIRCENKLKNI